MRASMRLYPVGGGRRGAVSGSHVPLAPRNGGAPSRQARPPAHAAPAPRSTAGTVRSRMRKSRASDHWSMYLRSSRTHSSKLKFTPALDLPETREPRTHAEATHEGRLGELSHVAHGHGSEDRRSDISPRRTLKSCGSSSIELRRRNFPTGVIRGIIPDFEHRPGGLVQVLDFADTPPHQRSSSGTCTSGTAAC